MDFLNVNQLSKLTGVDRRTIDRRLKGLAPQKNGNRVKLYDAKIALKKILNPGGSGLDLTQEKARLSKLQADKVQLEVSKLRGELIEVKQVKEQAFNSGRRVRDRILNIPSRISHELAAETDPFKVEVLLTQALTEALLELCGGA